MLRRLGRLLRFATAAMALGGWLALIALAVGRIASDRFHFTQFISWIPPWLLLALAAIAMGPRVLLGSAPRPYGDGAMPPPRRGRVRRAVGLLIHRFVVAVPITLAAVYALFGLHLHRALMPARDADADLRIGHWNAMAPMNLTPGMFAPFAPQRQADGTFTPGVDLLCWSAAMNGAQAEEIIRSSLGEGYTVEGRGIFFVATRYPLLRLRSYTLGLQGPLAGGPRPDADARIFPVTSSESRSTLEYLYNTWGPSIGLPRRVFRNADPGNLMVIEIDTTAFRGQPTVIYALDLPSDPLRSKMVLARRAAAEMEELMARAGLPAADVVLGDLNIPRGSASLEVLLAGTTDAYAQAGWGLAPTWPYAHPLIAIDHLRTAPGWRAESFETVDLHMSDHLGIRVGLRAPR